MQVDDAKVFEIMGTDGVMDCLPDTDLAQLLAEQSPEELKDVSALCDKVATLVERLAKLNWFPYSSLGVPAWDDLGFWVVQVDRVVAEAPVVDYDEPAAEDGAAGAGGRPNFLMRELTGEQDVEQDLEEEDVLPEDAVAGAGAGAGAGPSSAADQMEAAAPPAGSSGGAADGGGGGDGGGDDDDDFVDALDEPVPDYDDEPVTPTMHAPLRLPTWSSIHSPQQPPPWQPPFQPDSGFRLSLLREGAAVCGSTLLLGGNPSHRVCSCLSLEMVVFW